MGNDSNNDTNNHTSNDANNGVDRRNFLRLAGLGGVIFASGLSGWAAAAETMGVAGKEDFFFVQLSDSHWGFEGDVNPDAKGTLQKAVATVNGLEQVPDFIVFTGDLTHTTDDPRERRQRLAQFREIVSALKVKTVYFMPGEHDAALDNGKAYQEFFGKTNYTFDHKGVHFIVLDNVSDPAARLGDEQLAWLAADLKQQPADARIVVFAHRPLFDLYPQWDWATRDGAKAVELLMPHANVTVFYGHIHQENHHMTGHIAHHSAKSLIFPLPAPGSQAKRTPLPWDSAHPYRGLGVRAVKPEPNGTEYTLTELAVGAAKS
ncbi:putative phosphohydrolase [Herbaspirillum sp. CF444]|uniref:metallophosphoesterase family protein n=1 Tax=Herbaspirillum sp. CF444 TaxID=1144319 RepID=UPI0002724B79|nr:metallophosphoesterase [Herbaspirillum sp. CF444]EJL92655.1 putative phosphohydrolase [Herbaspirillum sp. CF444]